jgi:hypothetical protein
MVHVLHATAELQESEIMTRTNLNFGLKNILNSVVKSV